MNIINSLIDMNLDHVVEDIFLLLDCQSLTNAEIAFPGKWSGFIQKSKKLYHKKVATVSSWYLIGGSSHYKSQVSILGTMA